MKQATFMKYIAAAAALMVAGSASAAWPERPITLVVPWAAGGGTDATARIIGSVLEKELGKPVNVVNHAGGNGVVGYQSIAGSKNDGYTFGMMDTNITALHHQGLTELSYKDYTPLALVNQDPEAIIVNASASYKDMGDLVKAFTDKPGTFKASGAGQGSIGHLGVAGLLKSLDLDLDTIHWVPSAGAAPAMIELTADGIQIVVATLPEGRSLIDAGKARPLALLADTQSAVYPDVPTLKNAIDSDWTIGLWRGIVAPKGLPDDIRDKMEAALKATVNSDAYKEFMAKQGYGVAYMDAASFGQFMEEQDQSTGELLRAVGLAK
ncbi:tripartite tricarboxylate transporter substrate binding protein [Castellaniella sp.]|uniref:tripartite tricarboxylate transporter substrate binding protein n=1 Tax=Castellaniella sp. TaxID=1955812 RepID=UPI0035625554